MIDLAFKKSQYYKYVSVYAKSASWSNSPRSSTLKFDVDSLKSSIKFSIENSYFSVGSLNFKQTISISIGVDCAPPLANLILFRYEYQFISKLAKSDNRSSLMMFSS